MHIFQILIYQKRLDKIEMYKKIASIENKDDMEEVTEELDR